MTTPFTAEQAFEAQTDGDPIMITFDFADDIIADHGDNLDTFFADTAQDWPNGFVDAAEVLAWLGY